MNLASRTGNRDSWHLVLAMLAWTLLTTGPAYRLRTWWGYSDPLDEDLTIIVVNAVAGVTATAWLALRGRWRRLDPPSTIAWGAFAGWLVVGALWSVDSGVTVRHGVQIALTLAVGAATVVVLGWVLTLWILLAAVHVGIVWSVAVIYLSRPGALHANGDWAGVFFNSNSLALYAAIGLLTVAFAVGSHSEMRRVWRVLLIGLAVVDVRVIIGSNSWTPMLATAAGATAAGVVWWCRRFVNRVDRARRVLLTAATCIALVATVAWLARGRLLGSAGRDRDLAGRAALWDVSFQWARERPLIGYGYMGLWSDDEFRAAVTARRGYALPSAHNTFVEVYVGAGLIGLALLIVAIGILGARWVDWALTSRDRFALLPIALLVFVVVENLTETLVLGNQLLVAIVGTMVVRSGIRARGNARAAHQRARRPSVEVAMTTEPPSASGPAVGDR